MLLSSLGLGLHKPQLFRSKRTVNRAFGFCHSLGFDGSSAPYGNACVERDRPFPHVPSNALNYAILDAAIFHVVKNTFDLCHYGNHFPLPSAFGVLGANRGFSEQRSALPNYIVPLLTGWKLASER